MKVIRADGSCFDGPTWLDERWEAYVWREGDRKHAALRFTIVRSKDESDREVLYAETREAVENYLTLGNITSVNITMKVSI